MNKWAVLILLFFSSFSNAESEWYQYERIMLIKSKKNFILNEGLITYHKNNKWYVSLEDLFDSIGIDYKFAKNQRIVEGFIFHENEQYRMDLNKCEIIIIDKSERVPCESFIPLDDLFLVDISILEKITPIKFEINSLNSSIVLNYKKLFPPEAAEERSSRSYGRKDNKSNYAVQENHRDWLDGFNFDQSLSFEASQDRGGKKRSSIRHESALSAEVLKSELYTDYRGINEKQDSFWLSLERNDYRERIFGDVGLSELKFVHFNSPTINLVGGGKKIIGGYFSNRSIDSPLNFTKEDFSGPLENGWEVELYHNDILIGRDVGSSENQRYEFTGVDLFYGENRFQFIFYGPKGERRYENKKLNIENKFIDNRKITLTGSLGRDTDNKESYTLSASKTMFKRLQLEMFTTKDTDRRTARTEVYYGGAFSTFLDSTLIDGTYISDGAERALEAKIKFNLAGVNSSLSYINNSGVKSDVLGNQNPIDYAWSGYFLFPIKFVTNLQMYTSFSHKKKYGLEPVFFDVLNRISYSIMNLYVSNTFSIENNTSINEIFLRYSLGSSTLKFKNRLDHNGVRDSELGYSYTNRRRHSYGATVLYDYESRLKSLSLRVDKKFDKFFAGLSSDIDSQNSMGVALNISYGLVHDKEDGVHLYNSKTTEYANIKALAFHDKNSNGIRDKGEKAIPDIEFYRLSGNDRQVTNKLGHAFFTFVQPLKPTDVKISLQNIDNVYMKSTEEGKRVWGRAGKTALLEFPLSIQGDIEGEVEFIKRERESINIKGMIFSKGKEYKSFDIEKDGYFYLSGISPGEYTVRIKCDECQTQEFTEKFIMPEEGDSIFIDGVRL